jgi:Zn-dependent protease
MLRTFRFSIATKSLDRMTRWASLQTQSLGLRDTLRCALPNLFLALALFLLPFWVLDRRRYKRFIWRSSFLKNLGLSTFAPKLLV